MSNPALVSVSTLTDRYQTTIPQNVRKALSLHKREQICFTIQENGEVVLSRIEKSENDPVLRGFLTLIADDISQHPENLLSVSSAMKNSIEPLIGGVDIDLDTPLPEEE